jgi:hypothetical protein
MLHSHATPAISPRIGGPVKKLSHLNVLMVTAAALLLFPYAARAQQTGATVPASSALAQQNVPAGVQGAAAATQSAVKRWGAGIEGGIGLDPELIMFGGHARIGPFFSENLVFRPGIEFGLGEVTTLFGINLDVVYTLPGADANQRWAPYIGAGPNFALSHRGFSTEEGDKVDTDTDADTDTDTDTSDEPSRFDFGDTDFSGGFNFIVGAHSPGGMFVEMKATAWGVSVVRIIAGFNF